MGNRGYYAWFLCGAKFTLTRLFNLPGFVFLALLEFTIVNYLWRKECQRNFRHRKTDMVLAAPETDFHQLCEGYSSHEVEDSAQSKPSLSSSSPVGLSFFISTVINSVSCLLDSTRPGPVYLFTAICFRQFPNVFHFLTLHIQLHNTRPMYNICNFVSLYCRRRPKKN